MDQRERERETETYNQKMVNTYVLYHLQETVLFYPSSCLLEAERQLVCEYFDQRWSTICLSASFTLLVIYIHLLLLNDHLLIFLVDISTLLIA